MNLIKKYMHENNIGFTELCQKSGLAKSTVYRAIKDETIPNATKIGTLKSIALALNTPIFKLIVNDEPTIEEIRINNKSQKNGNGGYSYKYFFGEVNIKNINGTYTIPFRIDFNLLNIVSREPISDPENLLKTTIVDPYITYINIQMYEDTKEKILESLIQNSQKYLTELINKLINSCNYEFTEADKTKPIEVRLMAFIGKSKYTVINSYFDGNTKNSKF